MLDRNTFMETLRAVAEVCRTSTDPLSKEEILNYFEGMELIRPLYCVLEEDIIRWKNHNNLQFIACACKFVQGTEEEILPTFSARKDLATR